MVRPGLRLGKKQDAAAQGDDDDDDPEGEDQAVDVDTEAAVEAAQALGEFQVEEVGHQEIVAGFVDDDFLAGLLVELLVRVETLVERVEPLLAFGRSEPAYDGEGHEAQQQRVPEVRRLPAQQNAVFLIGEIEEKQTRRDEAGERAIAIGAPP